MKLITDSTPDRYTWSLRDHVIDTPDRYTWSLRDHVIDTPDRYTWSLRDHIIDTPDRYTWSLRDHIINRLAGKDGPTTVAAVNDGCLPDMFSGLRSNLSGTFAECVIFVKQLHNKKVFDLETEGQGHEVQHSQWSHSVTSINLCKSHN